MEKQEAKSHLRMVLNSIGFADWLVIYMVARNIDRQQRTVFTVTMTLHMYNRIFEGHFLPLWRDRSIPLGMATILTRRRRTSRNTTTTADLHRRVCQEFLCENDINLLTCVKSLIIKLKFFLFRNLKLQLSIYVKYVILHIIHCDAIYVVSKCSIVYRIMECWKAELLPG